MQGPAALRVVVTVPADEADWRPEEPREDGCGQDAEGWEGVFGVQERAVVE